MKGKPTLSILVPRGEQFSEDIATCSSLHIEQQLGNLAIQPRNFPTVATRPETLGNNHDWLG